MHGAHVPVLIVGEGQHGTGVKPLLLDVQCRMHMLVWTCCPIQGQGLQVYMRACASHTAEHDRRGAGVRLLLVDMHAACTRSS